MNIVIAAVLQFAASPMGQKLLADAEEAVLVGVQLIFQHAVKQTVANIPTSSIASAVTPTGGAQ